MTDADLRRNAILIFGGLLLGAAAGMQAAYLLACRTINNKKGNLV